jgi:biopolymer transport protein ExbB/TolQ
MFENMFVGNSMWHLVSQSDLVSKLVVFSLFVLSIVCWTIFITKLIMLRMRKRDMQRALDYIKTVRSVEDLVTLSTYFTNTLPGRLTASVLLLLNQIIEKCPQGCPDEWEVMQYYLEQEVEQLVENESSYLAVLSTTAAVAPLLGLFGTVWGLVHAFIRISEKQAADITVVAPGIAEALITTLVGLIVAIPALVMYNYLANQIRKLEGTIISFADKISFLVRQILRG